jgi:DNA-binding protein HU-beta
MAERPPVNPCKHGLTGTFFLRPNHGCVWAAHVAHPKEGNFNMAPAPKKSKPVTLKHLAATLAEEHQLTKKGGEALLTDLVGLITKHLKKGERIRIVGLGILQVRKRAARMGRNPATGEAIKIKASKKVAFRAAKELKMAV